LIRNDKLEARQFFKFHFKWIPSQDQQKTFRRRLITLKVTLTGQSHFMLIFLLRKVTLRGHINSVKLPPHPQATVRPPLLNQRGGHNLLRLRGQFGRLEKKPSTLSALCYVQKKHNIRQPNESYCTLYSVQCTVYSRINSIKSLYAITSTPYNECTRLHQLHRIFWTNCVHSLYGVGVIA
jgi:hypothetical protein